MRELDSGDDFLWNFAAPVVKVLIDQAPHEGGQSVAVIWQRQLRMPLKLLCDLVELHRLLGEQSCANARLGMREPDGVCVDVPRVPHVWRRRDATKLEVYFNTAQILLGEHIHRAGTLFREGVDEGRNAVGQHLFKVLCLKVCVGCLISMMGLGYLGSPVGMCVNEFAASRLYMKRCESATANIIRGVVIFLWLLNVP